jgi:phenylacetate-CoA ligase
MRTERRLTSLLEHAAREVPFYRQRVTLTRSPSLAAFPVLTKPLLREHFRECMTEPLRREYDSGRRRHGYGWVPVKTGGSTGVPTTVIHDAAGRDEGRAARLYSQYMCGFPFGVPYFRLWGSMVDINRTGDSLTHRALSGLAGEILLNAFRMSDADIDAHIDTINRSRVKHLMAYVDAAEALCLYAQRNGREVRHLESVMACAGTVTRRARQTIEETLGSRVHNKYGSRECGDMACECEAGGLHVFSNRVAIEAVDDRGTPLAPGQPGRLLITLLANRSFPLIRYEIGDVGCLSEAHCSCGRPFPLMEGVEGRTIEFLTDTSGGYVSPVFIRHLVGVVHNPGVFRRYQMAQLTGRSYELALEPEPGAGEDSIRPLHELLIRDLRAVLGEDAQITIRQTERIAEQPSGKFLHTINKTRPRDEDPPVS